MWHLAKLPSDNASRGPERLLSTTAPPPGMSARTAAFRARLVAVLSPPLSAWRRRAGDVPAPARTSEVRATVVDGWEVRPTLDRANANRRPLAQAAGSFVAGSPLPQALIQCRQRLTYELRLGKLVIPCRGQHRSLWQTTRRWPSPRRPLHRPRPRPRTDRGLAATPHSEPDLTQRTSLRAEQRACATLFQGTSFPHLNWLRLPDQKWL